MTSATSLPAGFDEIVQISTPSSAGHFTMWRRTTTLSDPFNASDPQLEGPGPYAFRPRLENTANNSHSKAGPSVPATVTP